MKTLICRKAIDFKDLDPIYRIRAAHGSCGRSPWNAHGDEPIPVQVRIRRYGGMVPEVMQARLSRPDLGRLPVGSLLDCYV